MIRTAEEASLTALPRMKKSTLKYHDSEFRQGQVIHRKLDVKALYRTVIRGQWENIPGQADQAKGVVELNLSESPKEPECWIKVRLLFVRGVAKDEKAPPGKHDWAVFLTIMTGALEEWKVLLGDAVAQILETIESHVQGFFVQVLQLDPQTLRMEATSFNALREIYGGDCMKNTANALSAAWAKLRIADVISCFGQE